MRVTSRGRVRVRVRVRVRLRVRARLRVRVRDEGDFSALAPGSSAVRRLFEPLNSENGQLS